MRSKWISILGILCFGMMSMGLIGQTSFRGKVLDAETKTPVIGAKIGISGQGVGVLTNDIGYFAYTKYHQILDRDNVLEISAPGYATIRKTSSEIRQLFGTVSTIYLDKSSKKIKEKNLDKVTLYWDVSTSSGTRNFETEWDAVRDFITTRTIEKIELITFNTEIISNEIIDVKGNSINGLREKLKSLIYTGLSNYDLITERSSDAVILVSNGIPVYGEAQFDRNKPVFPVVTAGGSDTIYLNRVAQYTGGSLLSIPTTSTSSYIEKSTLKGTVKTVFGPIQGASIIRKGSLQEYFSKVDGSFEIPAAEGDVITFSYLGMHPKGIVVENIDTTLTIDLEPLAEILDEVLLKGRDANKDEKIVTAFGKESRDKLGYAANFLSAESIKPSAQFVSDILRGQFAGVIINGFGPNATIQIRGGGQTFGGTGSNGGPLWVIDNNLLSDVSLFDINTFVDPQNIASITILKSLAATVRYGTIGIDGAIIIKTKTGTQLETDLVTSTKSSALITGNNYKENLQLLNENSHQDPSYITEINQISNIKDRYARYKQMAATREPSVAFYVDMALYFQKYDNRIAEEILNKLAVLGGNNVKVLRVLAYLYEAGNQNDKARLVYERILKLAPGESQSYRDLAMIYQEVGAYNKSLELYINMLSSQIMGVNFKGLERVLSSELNRLVSRHKSKIDFKRLPNEFLRVGYDIDLRMVIEWSDRNVPFEFQFVNPRKKYYNWVHTLDQNKARLYEEQDQGFQIEEFIVDDAPSGDWLVNIQYLGQADEFTIPPYLKYTVYHNYGTPQETKEIKVIKLYLQDEKVTLSKINS